MAQFDSQFIAVCLSVKDLLNSKFCGFAILSVGTLKTKGMFRSIQTLSRQDTEENIKRNQTQKPTSGCFSLNVPPQMNLLQAGFIHLR